MKTRQVLAVVLSLAVTSAAVPTAVFAGAQGTATLGGTAKDEAKKPYSDYTVRARDTQQGAIAGTMPLDPNAKFSLTGLMPANYLVELLNKDGKVVCTEGPFNMTGQTLVKDNVKIDCGHTPAAWWLLGAAGAAGLTAGIIAATASASK